MKYIGIWGLGAVAACVTVHSVIPSYYNKWLNPGFVKQVKHPQGIMLTFDDGPDERYTGKLLELLKKEQVHAVFFVVLDQAETQRALIEQMRRDGHLVAFHSKTHQNAMLHSRRFMKEELEAGARFLEEIGETRFFYRPPWGLTNGYSSHYAKVYRMQPILWSVMAGDWKKSASVASIINICKRKVHPGSILCLHDAGEKTGGAYGAPLKTIKALEILIPYWKSKGYRFLLPE